MMAKMSQSTTQHWEFHDGGGGAGRAVASLLFDRQQWLELWNRVEEMK